MRILPVFLIFNTLVVALHFALRDTAAAAHYVAYCSHWLAVILSEHHLSEFSRLTKAPAPAALIVATYLVSLVVLLYVGRPISRWERWIGCAVMSSVRTRSATPMAP